MIEIDKLKLLLLNQDQCKLFDYLPKPLIPLHSQETLLNNNEHFYLKEEKNFELKVKEAFEAYQINKNSSDKLS